MDKEAMSQGSARVGRRLVGLCVGVVGLWSALAAAEAPVGSSLSGELSVTASGAASYQLPLLSPPGVIKPSLSFQYSSQSGNGPLGVGWSLGGLSQISRCPRIRSIDGVDDGIVQFNADDRLCLDGQRLILKSGSAYGADGAEYRTQMESDSKIVGRGSFASGTAWFQVWTKSGEVLEFGNTADSRLALTPAGSSTAVPYAWALNKASDRFSNYYTISYLQDNRMLYPQSIQYAGNSQAGTVPARILSLDWAPAAPRPDPIPAYLGGGVSGSIRYRLAGVSNNANPARYKLDYSLSGAGLSNLTKIRYCPDGSDANCLQVESQYGYDKDPVTGKRMSDPQLVLAAFGKNQGWGDQNTHPRQLADVNGDGRQDIVGFFNDGVYVAFGTATGFTMPSKKLSAFGVSAGGWSNNSQYPRMVVDINGDGLADIVGFASAGVFVALSTGEGFSAQAQWAAGYGTATGWSNMDEFPRTLADVDGDGLLDIVGFASNNVAVALNKRTHFDGSAAHSALTAFSRAAGWTSNDTYPRMLADMNGDGRADIAGFHQTGMWVSLSGPSSFLAATRWNTENWSPQVKVVNVCWRTERWAGQSVAPRMLADINGDGLPDIVAFDTTLHYGVNYGGAKNDCAISAQKYHAYVTSSIVIALNSGTAFPNSVKVGEEFPATGKSSETNVARNYMNSLANIPKSIDDIDQDGRSDIVRFSAAGCTQVFLSTGQGLALPACLLSNFGTMSNEHVSIADIEGSGNYVMFGYGDDGIRMARNTANHPTKILSLKSDLTESKVEYSTLVDPEVYQKGSGAMFPQVDLQGPMSVVKSISNPDGLGGTSLARYRYGGLRSHFDHGSLGFQWMESMDEASGALSYSEYNQGFPLTGTLARTQSQYCANRAQLPWSACELLSQEVSEWVASESGATADRKVYRAAINKTTEHTWLKSSSAP
jgi:hypothetical protein